MTSAANDTGERTDDDFIWYIAKGLIIHLEGIPAFYYPELLEEQYIYLLRTTRLRWRLESDMRLIPKNSDLYKELEVLRSAGDKFQSDIATYSHPAGHNYWTGTQISDAQLASIVNDYRQAMALPIRRIVDSLGIYVTSPYFKSVTLEESNA